MKSWKTTICGAICLAAGVVLFIKGSTVEGGVCCTVGIGLLSAKDNNVTGGTVQQ